MVKDRIKSVAGYFTKGEILLWLVSVSTIVISFLIFDRGSFLTLIASLIGVTSLIFNAKGNPFGQVLIIIFSVFYGIISYSFAYYGEMITYLGMTAPMSVFSLISWLKNPYNDNKSEVKVNKISLRDIVIMICLSAIVTTAFYFILNVLNTANLIPSTVSVLTSFIAVFLTFRRSPYFAIAYALNDIVLVVMWIMASLSDMSYISVAVCFLIFLVNDIYGFINWKKMQKRQNDLFF
ncbi:MAG: nicotinamide riboside transporter PnuC [Ruminococcus sp.]|nr:nicotinamide riboside transporter PnuC [Ruminococcus sp.]MDE7099339.1 nicotinamide riboside transporter PnuC [Ruminococcus sp.]